MSFEMREITSALGSIWATRPVHLHRIELFSTTSPHWRIDLDCNWQEDVTLEQRLAVFQGDSEMINRYLRDKSLVNKSLSTIVGKRLQTETKHLYFDVGSSASDVSRRAARAAELLSDMARGQPVDAHHKEIDIDEFTLSDGSKFHVSLLSQQAWTSILLLPANYHSVARSSRERIARAALPKVA